MFLCCAMTCVCYGLLCFRLLSARFLIGYGFVSRDDLSADLSSSVFPHTAGFLIGNIQHIEYLRFAIGVPPTSF